MIKKPRYTNFLSHPRIQLKYSFMVAFLVSISLALTQVGIYLFFLKLTSRYSSEAAVPLDVVTEATDTFLNFSILIFALTFLVAFGITIVILHRFVGPLVSVKRYFELLSQGQNPPPLEFRKEDEMHELATIINKYTHAHSPKN